MNTVVIVQARLGSQRLPRKVLLTLPNGLSVLETVLLATRGFSTVVVSPDYELRNLALECGCRFSSWFGERDVVGEFYFAAVQAKADTVVRVTADCPLLEREAISHALDHFQANQTQYFYNDCDGCDVEVFSFPALHEAFHEAVEREHVGVHIRQSHFPVIRKYVSKYGIACKSLNTEQDYRDICSLMGADNGGTRNSRFRVQLDHTGVRA